MTGGLGILGSESARALLEHGLRNLAIFDVVELPNEKLDSLRGDFPLADVLFFNVDTTDEAKITENIEAILLHFKRIDMLLCCAGIVHCDHALNITADKWRQVQNVNTTGAFLVAKAVAKTMIDLKSSDHRIFNRSIVFIASTSAHQVNFPQPQLAYNVSKAGIVHMTHCLAAEWACYGIRVNCISPGYMDTILNEGEALDQSRRVWISRTPMGRMGRADELAGVVIMLCSQAGSYITGADIKIDGTFSFSLYSQAIYIVFSR